MRVKFAQQDNTCSDGFQYYTCFKHAYAGCCSVDPCDIGTCPDGHEWSQRGETTIYETVTMILTSSTTSATDSTTSSDDSSTTLSSDSTQSSSNSITSTSVSNPYPHSSGSSGRNTDGLIAGIICGLVIPAILAILAVYCWRKKKWRQRLRLSAWWRFFDNKGIVNIRPSSRGPADDFIVPRGGGDPFAEFGGYHKSVRVRSEEPDFNNNGKGPENNKESQCPDSLGLPETGSHLRHNAERVSVSTLQQDQPLNGARLNETRLETADIPSMLPDVPSPRERTEASATSRRSSLTIPAQLRIGYNSQDEEQAIHDDTPPFITTPDGVILQANMSSFFNDDSSVRSSAQKGHALSFMDYNTDSEPSSLTGQSRQSPDTRNESHPSPDTPQTNISLPTIEEEQSGSNHTSASDSPVIETNPVVPQISIIPPSPNPVDDSGPEANEQRQPHLDDIESLSISGAASPREFTIICPPVLAQPEVKPGMMTVTKTDETQLDVSQSEPEVNQISTIAPRPESSTAAADGMPADSV